WTTAHDCQREGDVLSRGDGKVLDVEARSRLVIAEHETPSLFVCLDAFALQRRRQVEHDHVRRVMSENGGKVVPADSVSPGLEQALDPNLFAIVSVCRHGRHGAGSFVCPPRTTE